MRQLFNTAHSIFDRSGACSESPHNGTCRCAAEPPFGVPDVSLIDSLDGMFPPIPIRCFDALRFVSRRINCDATSPHISQCTCASELPRCLQFNSPQCLMRPEFICSSQLAFRLSPLRFASLPSAIANLRAVASSPAREYSHNVPSAF